MVGWLGLGGLELEWSLDKNKKKRGKEQGSIYTFLEVMKKRAPNPFSSKQRRDYHMFYLSKPIKMMTLFRRSSKSDDHIW
jgi:hypothetical protein